MKVVTGGCSRGFWSLASSSLSRSVPLTRWQSRSVKPADSLWLLNTVLLLETGCVDADVVGERDLLMELVALGRPAAASSDDGGVPRAVDSDECRLVVEHDAEQVAGLHGL